MDGFTAPPKFDMSDREKAIFKAVVLDYIRTGEPVASGNLAEKYSLNLSPASIRKVLHELEERGLLMQTYSSAGRTPTEEGFRVYADSLLEVEHLTPALQARIREGLAGSTSDSESLFAMCSRVLSNFTSFMGVVMAPTLSSMALKKLYFVRLEKSQVLAVLITNNGIIQNRLLSPPLDFSQEELNEVNAFLEEISPPFTLAEIKERLINEMGENRQEFEAIFKRAFMLASSTREAGEGEDERFVFMDGEGRMRLMGHPDFRDAEAMRTLFRAFENRRRLVDLLNDVTGGGRVRVVIGPSGEGEDGLALVASPYFTGGERGGALGVLGPRRLNYSEIVPVVDYAARVLSGLLGNK
jgi:heat-inducible transcriptional repressor